MNIPFTVEQFMQVFKDYNLAVWPMQILFFILGVIIVLFAINRKSYSNLVINLSLSFLWLWMGIVYHILFFTSINKGAYLFGVFYIIQSILILYFGAIKGKLNYHFESNLYCFTGILLIGFALIVYPILGYLEGHIYPAAPTFGLPCPTTIFTLGLFLLTDSKVPKIVMVIPILWSLIGYSAANKLGISEDIGLLISGIITATLIFYRDRKQISKS